MSEAKMTIGDCRVLSNKVAQLVLGKLEVRGIDDGGHYAVTEHELTGLIAEAVNEYFGVKR